MKLTDYTGRRFGMATAVERLVNGGSSRGSLWMLRCDCGNRFFCYVADLGRRVSCGCARRASNTKHGHSPVKGCTSTYRSWAGMVQRCTNPRNLSWPDYGGRGVQVCPRWVASFDNFLADMGEKPSNTSIDRIDNNGNYEPGNCRWATVKEQARNKRRTLLTERKAEELRSLFSSGFSVRYLAAWYGVSWALVNAVIKRRIWT